MQARGVRMAQSLPVRRKHSNARVVAARGHIEVARCIDRHAVATAFELSKHALVPKGAVRLHVQGDDLGAIGDIQRLLIRAEVDAVSAEVLASRGDLTVWTHVEKTAAGEIYVAFLADDQIVDPSQSFPIHAGSENLPLGRKHR